jgi:hypothetical protein
LFACLEKHPAACSSVIFALGVLLPTGFLQAPVQYRYINAGLNEGWQGAASAGWQAETRPML